MGQKNLFYTNYSKNFGFTLIILLLLLAAIGVILSYHTITSQRKAQEAKIEKTALQMESILAASISFYKKNNKWPKYPPKDEDDFNTYLPLGKLSHNPWDKEYVYQTIAEKDSFILTTDTLREDVAKNIAALLPQASVDPNSSKVKVEITSDLFGAGAVVIVNTAVKVLSPNDFSGGQTRQAVSFVCPSGFTGKIMVVPYYFTVGTKVFNQPMPTIKRIGLDSEPICTSYEGNNFQCAYTFDFQAQKCGDNPNPTWDNECAKSIDNNLTGPVSLNDGTLMLRGDGEVTLLVISYCQSY